MNLVQFTAQNGERAVAIVENGTATRIKGTASTYELAFAAIKAGRRLPEEIKTRGHAEKVVLSELVESGRLLSPIDHPDPAHLYVTGTGLTHLGSAATRDSMHQSTHQDEEKLTDSMKMFKMGLEGGKPAVGEEGVQPEWFYKGNGFTVIAPEHVIPSPAFAKDAGEEPEIAGIYIIGPDGRPHRLGFAIANEFSDHITERGNYLWLAHSKLRACSFGPELRVGDLPAHVEGMSRIRRNGDVIWEKPFLSGETNMSHSIANLEYHHFKYDLFCNPGDVHVHCFGTATLSFADNISTIDGDVFELDAPQFGLPLRNPVQTEAERPVEIPTLY